MLQPRQSLATTSSWVWRNSLPTLVTLGILLFTAIFFTLTTRASASNRAAFTCYPDGNIDLPWNHKAPECFDGFCAQSTTFEVGTKTRTYDPLWDPSLFLSITLGFGDLTFPTAKGIDCVWDLVVGRGGQILLGIVVYRLFRRSIMLTTETYSVSIPLFASMTSGTTELYTLWILGCEIFRDRGKRLERPEYWCKIRLFALVFVIGYLFTFATFVSIMTGYQAKTTPYIRNPSSQDFTPASKLYIPQLLVSDGRQVGLGDDFATEGNTVVSRELNACT